jgi:hypothetical protein
VPVRVAGNIGPPTKTHDVRPVYPVSMREAGREGGGLLQFIEFHLNLEEKGKRLSVGKKPMVKAE